MTRVVLNSQSIPAGVVQSSDLEYPLTNFSSTGIDDNASNTAITINANGSITIAQDILNYVAEAPSDSEQYARINGAWAQVQGGIEYTSITSNTTAVADQGIIADTSAGAFTITLPATPSTGDKVFIADGSDWSNNNLTIDRNGSTIENSNTDFVLDYGGVNVGFIYDGSTWQVYPQAGLLGLRGIDDNSTNTAITIDSTQNVTLSGDTLTFSDSGATITTSGVNNSFNGSTGNTGTVAIYGGPDYLSGSGVAVYGASHANQADKIRFFTSGFTERVVINADGDVGIGTDSPTAVASALTLHINDDTNGAAVRIGDASTNMFIDCTTAGGTRVRANSGEMLVGTNASSDLNFITSSQTRMTILGANGRVGIGNTDPQASLTVDTAIRVSGFVPTLQIHETDGANNQNYQLRVVNGDLKFQTNDDAFASAVTVATFDTNGNLGIGTSTPLAVNGGKVLEIESATGSEIIIGNSTTGTVGGEHIGGFLFKNSDTSATQPHYAGLVAKAADSFGFMDLEFYAGRETYETSGTPHLFIAGSNTDRGYIGIGTTSPQHFLDINVGNASPPTHKGHLRLSGGALGNSGHGGIEFTGSTFGSGYGWRIQNEDPGGQTPLVIYSRENSATWTEVARFRGSAVGGGIAFNGDTTAENALDDYEEGQYTVYLYDAATGGNAATPGRPAYYTKIGRQVTVTFFAMNNIDTTGLTAGNNVYFNLPFTSGSTGRYVGNVLHHGLTYAGNSNYQQIMPMVLVTSARCYLTVCGYGVGDTSVKVSDITSGADDIVTFSLTYHV